MAQTPLPPPPGQRGVLDDAKDEVQRRTRILPLPPAGFDPLRASDPDLNRFGLPARPDAKANPRLFSLWERMLGPRLTFVPPEVEFEIEVQNRFFLRAAVQSGPTDAAEISTPTRWGTSPNWSGAIIAARDGQRFTSVWGTWKVPRPKLPPGASDTVPPPEGAYRCSTWIGLDGHRTHSKSLPQLGTTQAIEFSGGKARPEVWAWSQWWVRGKQFGEVRFKDLPLEPGDEVICALTVQSPVAVVFTIKNQSTGALASILWAAGQVPEDPATGDRSDAPVQGSSAQWIAERPMVMGQTDLYPLPDYEAVLFENCAAEMRPPTKPTDPPVPRDLTAARLIRLFETRRNPHRSAFISVPTPPDLARKAVRVSYRNVP